MRYKRVGSAAELEVLFADHVFLERIRRASTPARRGPDTVLSRGDAAALTARRRVVAQGLSIGIEIEDRDPLGFPVDALGAVVTNSALADRPSANGVFQKSTGEA